MDDSVYLLEIAYPDPVPPGERKELVKGDWGPNILDTNMFGFHDYKTTLTERGPRSWGFVVSVGNRELRRIASVHQKFGAQAARPGTTGNPQVVYVGLGGGCFFD